MTALSTRRISGQTVSGSSRRWSASIRTSPGLRFRKAIKDNFYGLALPEERLPLLVLLFPPDCCLSHGECAAPALVLRALVRRAKPQSRSFKKTTAAPGGLAGRSLSLRFK